jgi:hypothetical protein
MPTATVVPTSKFHSSALQRIGTNSIVLNNSDTFINVIQTLERFHAPMGAANYYT